ncbi:hypothetical protein FRC04_007610 [Tulasnella sp. 424]|nr:hypothetical protein FRC04_007610 [Tulasnella sp. 424]KAG8979043.1 hypothetical protein FRC05_009253 [Tulasnella sp. 425]
MTSTAAKVKEEAEAPQGYKYSWSADTKSEFSADEFVAKFKPSIITDDGSKPWIWMCGPGYKTPYTEEDAGEAMLEGVMKLTETAEKVEAIQHDASIPVRANKKTGAKSKKEVREEIQAEAKDALRAIAQKHRFTNGKWLCYGNTGNIDGIWAKLARSIAAGPLSTSSARLGKVSTAKRGEGADSHVICLYLPDIFDETAARDVLKILIQEHGVIPSGAKPDLYTHIGLDSKHKSGIRSTALRDSHDASKATAFSKSKGKTPEPKAENEKADEVDPSDHKSRTSDTKKKPASPPQKVKPKAQPRKEDDDDDKPSNPFASDDDEELPASQKAQAARREALFKATGNGTTKQAVAISKPKVPKSKIEIAKETATLAKKQSGTMKAKERANAGPKPTARRTDVGGDTESEDEVANTPTPPVSSKARGKKRAAEVSDDDDEEEEEEEEIVKPKAKARRRK